RPIWLTPVYFKGGSFNWAAEAIRIEKSGGDELNRSPLWVDVLVWKDSEYPHGKHNTQPMSLSIAIPPGPDGERDKSGAKGGKDMTGVEIVGGIASAVKVVKDAPAALKVLRDLGMNLGLFQKEAAREVGQLEIDETEPIGA